MRYTAFLCLTAALLLMVACDSNTQMSTSVADAFKTQRQTMPPLQPEDAKVLEAMGFCEKGKITETDISCDSKAFSIIELTPGDDNRHDLFFIVTDNSAYCGSGGCSLFLCKQEGEEYEATWQKQGVFLQQREVDNIDGAIEIVIAEKLTDCDLDSEDWVDVSWAEVVYSFDSERAVFLPKEVIEVEGKEEEPLCRKALECLIKTYEF